MDREEAIKDLEKLRAVADSWGDTDAIALDMAIEALKTQDATEELTQDLADRLNDGKFQHWVQVQNTIETEQKWIPCSERLPEDKCDVLVLFNWNMAVGYIYDGEWRINSGDNLCTPVFEDEPQPIAWMPLPEPYKSESEE